MKICFIISKKCPPILHWLNKIPIKLNIIYKKDYTNVTRKTKLNWYVKTWACALAGSMARKE